MVLEIQKGLEVQRRDRVLVHRVCVCVSVCECVCEEQIVNLSEGDPEDFVIS